MHISLLLFLSLVVLGCCIDTTLISSHEQMESNGSVMFFEAMGVFPYYFSADLEGVSGQVVLRGQGCSEEDFRNASGKIVIVELFGCALSVKLNNAFRHGAVAIGVAMKNPGSTFNYFVSGLIVDHDFPVFMVSLDDLTRWENKTGGGEVIVMLREKENEYGLMYQAWWFVATKVLFLSLFALMTIYIVWKLIQTIVFVPVLHVIPVCLIVELVSSIVRMLFWIDILGSVGVYSDNLHGFLFSVSYGPSFVVQLLLSLYWLDSLNAANVKFFLSPSSLCAFLIIGISLILLAVINAFLPSLSVILYVSYSILTLFTLSIVVFYVIAIIKLSKFVAKAKIAKTSSKSKMRTANHTLLWYIASGLFCLIFVIVASFSVLAIGSATKQLLIFEFLSICLFGMSFSKIYPTKVTKKNSSNTTAKSVANSQTKHS